MPKRIIIRGAEIVTMDAALGDFAAADILIEDGNIHAVGPSLTRRMPNAIDGAGMIALPGIIDAHTCLWQTVLRGYVPDLWPGTYYSEAPAAAQPLHGRRQFQCSLCRRLRDAVLRHDDRRRLLPRHSGPDYAPASIAALKETGIRHLFTYSFMPVLPDEFARPEDRLADGRLVYDKFHDPAGLTTVGFGVDSIGALGHGWARKAARLFARR